MTKLGNGIRHFLVSEDGPTAVEYALMVGLIATAVIAAMAIFQSAVTTAFTNVQTTLSEKTKN